LRSIATEKFSPVADPRPNPVIDFIKAVVSGQWLVVSRFSFSTDH
jgi:hypothetical protein